MCFQIILCFERFPLNAIIHCMNFAQPMSKRKAEDENISPSLETKLLKLSTLDDASRSCGCENKKLKYNFKGLKKLYCKSHKKDGMLDVTREICESKDCIVRASFNEEGLKKGKFCADHKEPNMVNVKDKTCEGEGCKKRPNLT